MNCDTPALSGVGHKKGGHVRVSHCFPPWHGCTQSPHSAQLCERRERKRWIRAFIFILLFFFFELDYTILVDCIWQRRFLKAIWHGSRTGRELIWPSSLILYSSFFSNTSLDCRQRSKIRRPWKQRCWAFWADQTFYYLPNLLRDAAMILLRVWLFLSQRRLNSGTA